MKAGCNLKLRMPHNNLEREQFFAAPFFSEYGAFLLFLLIYVSINLLFLGKFPVVHSDESWLAGLTLEIMKTGNPAVTEPFFTIFPRHPHAIKILYHLTQIPFILTGGYNHISVRVLSLAFGALTLFFFYRIHSGPAIVPRSPWRGPFFLPSTSSSSTHHTWPGRKLPSSFS